MSSHFSYISNAHPSYIEQLYNEYKAKKNTDNIDPEWVKFFEGFDFALERNNENDTTISSKEFQVLALINAYRQRAHLISNTNPIRERRNRNANLDLVHHALTEADLSEHFVAGELLGLGKTSLKNIVEHLKKIYCGTIGFEYAYILDTDQQTWLQHKIEKTEGASSIKLETKKRILQKLNETVVFEEFLSKKYIGQKRFSLEGGESTIPALDAIINKSAELGAEEIVIGMAHRGRLNILANILGKTYEQIFNEFEGNNLPEDSTCGGDVKYHLGFSSEVVTLNGKNINLKLTPNPSHLEAVAAVVSGYVRAKGDTTYKCDWSKIVPIILHGDAALAGQGSCYELLQMSELTGYKTGGSIHFVINNQIGFTTDFDDARSSNYTTSLAAVVNAPVFHVNGDDPEAVVYCCKLAVEYRNQFKKDVFIDMVCYRKHGHNEGDDPQYTQPDMYRRIAQHANPRELYIAMLALRGDIEKELAEKMEKDFWSLLQVRLDKVKEKQLPYTYQEAELAWRSMKKNTTNQDVERSPTTAITEKNATLILDKIHETPVDFSPINKMKKMLEGKNKMWKVDKKLDWQLGELLAYGSILLDGNDVRMSGQDVKRGTFSHRHVVIMDEQKNTQHNRLNTISDAQGKFRIYNSLLSEFAVLGFEFGYSLAHPNTLCLWEAQFGDFANGAQTIIDQFIMSSQTKWQRQSGLVLLLPHGYEGQGPEHSSARLERFLQGCGENNVSITNITTPANLFHAMRRQLQRPFRSPLINMSPKSLLRHPLCVSSLSEFTNGAFKEVFEDDTTAKIVTKIVFCTGKIYYELLDRKNTTERTDIALIRLEQLYPLPTNQINKIIEKNKNAQLIWCQEEPANMGAWQHLCLHLPEIKFNLVSRKIAASTATGFNKQHQIEQEQIINTIFEKIK